MFDLHSRLPMRAGALWAASLILVAACSATGAAPTTVAPTATATPTPPAATTAASTQGATATSDGGGSAYGGGGGGRYGGGDGATATPTAASSVTVTVSGGGYLVAPDGRTLYVFDMDPIGTMTSACTSSDGCDVTWPALVVATGGKIAAGAGVTGKLALITGEDGLTQVTFKGRPLYEYSGDTGPGQTTGDGVDGVWHTATP